MCNWTVVAEQEAHTGIEGAPAGGVHAFEFVEPQLGAPAASDTDLEPVDLAPEIALRVEPREEAPELTHAVADRLGVVRIGASAGQRLLKAVTLKALPTGEVLPVRPVEPPHDRIAERAIGFEIRPPATRTLGVPQLRNAATDGGAQIPSCLPQVDRELTRPGPSAAHQVANHHGLPEVRPVLDPVEFDPELGKLLAPERIIQPRFELDDPGRHFQTVVINVDQHQVCTMTRRCVRVLAL